MLTTGAVAKPEEAISPDEAVKDPYVLEFLNLNTGATATKATNTTAQLPTECQRSRQRPF
jgi:predicted nuclease of restriction endonuclease-like (RecB) superfamily